MAKDHYFHPAMKNSLSIKDVLAAAWATNVELREKPFFNKYSKRDAKGKIVAPYETLPPLPIGEKEEVVREGTGAMRRVSGNDVWVSQGECGTAERL